MVRAGVPGGTARMFVAVLPPAEALDDLERFVEPRIEAGADERLRWVRREQWHITLAFLPEVADHQLDALTEGIDAAAQRRTPARLRLAGAGTFPDPTRASVLYAAVRPESEDDAEQLRRLATNVRAAAQQAGIPVEGGSFVPHLTLGRFRPPAEATRWLRVFEAYGGPWWAADRIALVESHLGGGPGGRPRYEIRHEARLPSGTPGPFDHWPDLRGERRYYY